MAAGRALPSMPKSSDVEVGNYLRKLWSCQGRFQPCRSAYCATCFEPHELDMFEVKLPQDLYGASLAEVEVKFSLGWQDLETTCVPHFNALIVNAKYIMGRDLV